MKRLSTFSFFSLVALLSFAQTAKEEIYADILKAGSNHMAYQAPTEELTKAPKGYVPFYLDHYGRHGSRWLLSDNDYTRLIKALKEAKDKGVLTALGEETLTKLQRFYPCTINRLGDLTTVGERQHHGIGKRMTERFPEIFSGKTAEVDAKSTTVIRCILSMTAECEEITAFNPQVKMHNDVGEPFQPILNRNWDKRLNEAGKNRWGIVDQYKHKYTHPERFCKALFSDESYWNNKEFNAPSFMRAMFYATNNMQSHDNGEDMWNLFTKDEVYDLWKIVNVEWYLGYGPAPQSQGLMPFSQRYLLRNMIESADTVIKSKTYTNGASLRFGHEVCVMPLACLMELDSCGRKVEDLDHLEDYWVNYRIFPMACNVQLVFYRPKKSKVGSLNASDILVKALLNEKEATLPIETDQYPYYKWEDLRKYYMQKLDSYGELFHSPALRSRRD